MGMFGIVIMVMENELWGAGVYTKVSTIWLEAMDMRIALEDFLNWLNDPLGLYLTFFVILCLQMSFYDCILYIV